MSGWRRTHTCGELREGDVGKTVVLNGWAHAYRDHGVFVFIDLRDRYGITQVVFEPERGQALFQLAQEVRSEFVLSVKGKVARRLAGKEKPGMPTGMIEVKVEEMEILNRCPTPPFEINEFPGDELAERRLAPAIPLPRSAPAVAAADAGPAASDEQGDSRSPRRPGISRDRNSLPGPEHARRAPAIIWCRRGLRPAAGTRCRSRRNFTSNC